MDRLTAKLGANAKAKESQVGIKALEASVAQYTATMEPIESPPGETGPEFMRLTSAGVREIIEAQSRDKRCTVCRVNAVGEEAVEDGAQQAVAAVLARRGNSIGWLGELCAAAEQALAGDGASAAGGAVEAQVPGASAEPVAAEASKPVPAEAEPEAPSHASAMETIAQLDDKKRQALAKKAEKVRQSVALI
jgi:hypothetical protein